MEGYIRLSISKMTKVRVLGIVIDAMILPEMQRFFFYLNMLVKMYTLGNKIKTILFIKLNKTGTVNVDANDFIFAYKHF